MTGVHPTRWLPLMLIALASCDAPFAGNGGLQRGTVSLVLSRDVSAQNAPSGPFVSVIDSVYARVLGSDAVERTFARRLGRRDTSATFPLELPEGRTIVDVRVISTTATRVVNDLLVVSPTVLMDGADTTSIASDGFTLRVRVTPRAPVMLLTPDTVRLLPVANDLPQSTFTLQNRGTDTLQYVVSANGFLFGRANQGATSTLIGRLGANGQATIRVVRLAASALTAPVTVTITSGEGRVSLVVLPLQM